MLLRQPKSTQPGSKSCQERRLIYISGVAQVRNIGGKETAWVPLEVALPHLCKPLDPSSHTRPSIFAAPAAHTMCSTQTAAYKYQKYLAERKARASARASQNVRLREQQQESICPSNKNATSKPLVQRAPKAELSHGMAWAQLREHNAASLHHEVPLLPL